MKKQVLTEQNKHQLIQRILSLQAGTTPQWGSMTVNEMMFHCAKINTEILKAKEADAKPTIRQRLIKNLVLWVMNQLPKGVKTNPKYLKTNNDDAGFIAERDNLITTIHKIADYKEPIHSIHPFFGPMKTNEWRRFVQMHTDHHLRQFSV